MNTHQTNTLNTPARIALTVLTASILAACGGGGGVSGKTHPPIGGIGGGSIGGGSGGTHQPIGGIDSEGIGGGGPIDRRKGGNSFIPSAPKPTPPSASKYNGAGVNVGVIDGDFDDSRTSDHFRSIESQLKERFDHKFGALPSTTSHGALVSRVIAGRDLGDGWPAGAANGANLYQVVHGTNVSAFKLHKSLEDLASRDVKIVNNSWTIDQHLTATQYFERPENRREIALYREVLTKAVHDKGQLLIWATGNSGFDEPTALAAAPALDKLLPDDPALEKGWLAVTKVTKESLALGALAPNRDACGLAANWCLTAMAPELSGF